MENTLINKPHCIFFIAIPMVILIGILTSNEVFSINIHDTYFVIGYLDFALSISILFSILGIVYLIILKTGRKLFKLLS